MNPADQVNLAQFARHTPRILRRQLILQLTEQFCGVTKGQPISSKNLPACKPSIQRFHAALLFVDISGFTALSLRLSVEELKNHINEYFTKMLDIVDKHGGDVIKFAGDALFIIWETDQSTALNEESRSVHFDIAKQKALRKAVDCGKEINAACGNHKINIPGQSMSVSNVIRSMFGSQSKNPVLDPVNSGGSEEASVAYLNVHSGVSMGLMAGIDIGADNRWEYFLIGEPLSKVAEAEGQASTGDMIICPESHTILHGKEDPIPLMRRFGNAFSSRFNLLNKHSNNNTPTDSPTASSSVKAMKCGCFPLKAGYCKMDMGLPTNDKTTRKSRPKGLKIEVDNDAAMIDILKTDLNDAFLTFKPMFTDKIEKYVKPKTPKTPHSAAAAAAAASLALVDPSQAPSSSQTELTPTEAVKEKFVTWALSSLTDEIARHCHNAVRHEYTFEAVKRSSIIENNNNNNSISGHSHPPRTPQSVHSLHNDSPNNSHHDSSALRPIALSPIARRESHASKHTASGNHDKNRETPGLTAEIRNVTVMFVKIDLAGMELMIDSTKRLKVGGGYRFLPKTVNEKFADMMLLDRLQSCIEALSVSFASQGGQMRQFIVDDKGTVCIGTFGLRGSMSDDNAAAALNTAQMIVTKLKAIGLNCSIGVTVGRAYCGLVGSAKRHEYAVMGPSTNLSARLMCKAPPGGVICDIETQMRDRTHQFEKLNDIIAKGYKMPVGTFKPKFEGEDVSNEPARMRTDPEFLRSASREDNVTDLGSVDNSLIETNDMVSRITRSKFTIERNANNKVVKMELHGRRAFLKTAINFAFSTVMLDPGAGEMSSPTNKLPVFNHCLPARFIGIVGAQGIGKTSFVQAITQRIFSIAASSATYNIQLFKSRVSFAGCLAFYAWKPIITEMLIRIFRHNTPAVQQAQMGRRRSIVAAVSASAGVGDIKAGIDHALLKFPKHLQKFKALFGFIAIVEEDKAATDALKLSEYEKVMHSTQLLLNVMQLYLKETGNLVFITLEDIHLFDQHSLALLYEVYHCVPGVVVLFTGRLQTATVHMDCSDASNLNGFTSLLDDPSKYLEIQLDALTKIATTSMVKDIFALQGHQEVDESVFSTVFEVSRGNPFYTYEIAHSMAESKDKSNFKMVNATHCIRIEEVICYRFDQLNNTAQTLLKVAAVAYSNSTRFSLDLLAAISFDAESNTPNSGSRSGSQAVIVTLASTTRNIASLLLEIISSESFIHVTMGPNVNLNNEVTKVVEETTLEEGKESANSSDVDISSLTVEMLMSGNYLFEFSISLEQLTIYGLLLDDQKQAIHERIADYFNSVRDAYPHAVHNYAEESFHWHRAGIPGNAMLCCYRASELEVDEWKRHELISMTYNMFSLLKEESTVHERNKSELRLIDIKSAFESSFEHKIQLKSKSSSPGANSPYSPSSGNGVSLFSLEQVHEIFEGSSLLLRVGLQTHYRKAQHSLCRLEDPVGTLMMLEDALQMVLLGRNPILMDSNYLSAVMQKMHNGDSKSPKQFSWSLKKQSSTDDLPVDQVHFYLFDFIDIIIPILSAHLTNCMQLNVLSRETVPKSLYLVDRFLDLTHNMADKETMVVKVEHKLQALILGVLVFNFAGTYERADGLFVELTALYKFDEHSALLIDAFGVDQMPLCYATTAQRRFLTGGQTDGLVQSALESIEKQLHINSLCVCFVGVVSVLAFTGRFADALNVVVKVDSLMKQKIALHAEPNVVQKTIDLLTEWLTSRLKLSQLMESSSETSSKKVAEVSEKLGEVDSLIARNGSVNPPDSSAAAGFGQLIRFGANVKCLLADICVVRLSTALKKGKLERDKLKKFLDGLCSYGVATLVHKHGKTSDGHTGELLFNRFRIVNALTLLVGAVQTFGGAEEVSEFLSVIQKTFSKNVLEGVAGEAKMDEASQLVGAVDALTALLHPSQSEEQQQH